MVDKKLKDIIASRGKKGTDRHENAENLAYLATVSTCASQEIESLIMLISAQFDISGSMSAHMPIPIWKRCVNNLLRIDKLLSENKQITLTEDVEPQPKPPPEDIVAGAPVQLWGSLCAFTERLDDEYFKSMQSIDPHSKEYLFRMQDESLFIVLCAAVVRYYENRDDATEIHCKLSLRLLEHLYYKPEPVYEALRKFATAKLEDADALEAKLAADAVAAAAAAKAKEEAKRIRDLAHGHLDADLVQPRDGAARPRRVPRRVIRRGAVVPRRDVPRRPRPRAPRAGRHAVPLPRALHRAREARTPSSDAVPHAHQPRALGVGAPRDVHARGGAVHDANVHAAGAVDE